MSTIFILKQILDLLYDESKRGELVTTDVKMRLHSLEGQLEERNKEISRLYTENLRLENALRKYENDFEILSKMPLISVDNSDTHQDTQQDTQQDKKENKTEENKSEEKTIDLEEIKRIKKQKRKEYLTEYQRKYRKAKKEQNMEMNV